MQELLDASSIKLIKLSKLGRDMTYEWISVWGFASHFPILSSEPTEDTG